MNFELPYALVRHNSSKINHGSGAMLHQKRTTRRVHSYNVTASSEIQARQCYSTTVYRNQRAHEVGKKFAVISFIMRRKDIKRDLYIG
jgi:hypothetical protein